MELPAPKPVIWIGSSRRDFRALPEEIKSRMGYPLYVAQLGGKHRDAKPLKGFGGAGVVEIVADHQGDTFRHCAVRGGGLRTSRFPEESEEGPRDAKV